MKKKTDNDNLSKKLAIRLLAIDALKKRGVGSIHVLDCFAGDGTLWRLLKKEYGNSIQHVGIDTEMRSVAKYLGDNRKYLQYLPINDFDLIDIDAYGVPYEQLQIISKRQYKGIIVGTFIQCLYGGLPYAMLEELGYSRKMVRKITKLFFANGWKKWSSYLKLVGYDSVHVYHCANKHYFCCFPKEFGS